MIGADLSYAANVILTATSIGSFFAGRAAGHQANEAQGLTIEAQSQRIDLLEKERTELKADFDKLQIKFQYLEELVLRGPFVVQQGPVPDMLRGRRPKPSTNPAPGANG